MLLIQVLLIQVSTIIIFDNLYVQNQSTTTAQALARTKTRMTTWLNSNFRGRWKEVSGPNVTLASNQWMIVMRIGKQGGNYDYGAISTMPEIPGLMLWKSGHAGVYIGGGYAIEAMGTSKGVVKTKVSDRNWQGWGKLPYIDYREGN